MTAEFSLQNESNFPGCQSNFGNPQVFLVNCTKPVYQTALELSVGFANWKPEIDALRKRLKNTEIYHFALSFLHIFSLLLKWLIASCIWKSINCLSLQDRLKRLITKPIEKANLKSGKWLYFRRRFVCLNRCSQAGLNRVHYSKRK